MVDNGRRGRVDVRVEHRDGVLPEFEGDGPLPGGPETSRIEIDADLFPQFPRGRRSHDRESANR